MAVCAETGTVNLLLIVGCVVSSLILVLGPFYALDSANKSVEKEQGGSVLTKSISWAIETTPDELAIDSCLIVANIILIFVAAAREVQIKVLFLRAGHYERMAPCINTFNSVLLFVACVSYIVTVVVDTSEQGTVHFVAASAAWGLSLAYQLIHIFLTLYQRWKCYSIDCNQKWFYRYSELIFFVVAWCVACVCSVFFIFYQLMGEIPGWQDEPLGEARKYFYEWLGFSIMSATYMIVAVVFYRDPVEDELKDFFGKYMCCGKCGRMGESEEDTWNSIQLGNATNVGDASTISTV